MQSVFSVRFGNFCRSDQGLSSRHRDWRSNDARQRYGAECCGRGQSLVSCSHQKSPGALKLTISKFYRVNGDSTQTKGVTSDVVLPSLLNVREIGEDSLDNALEFDRITRANTRRFRLRSPMPLSRNFRRTAKLVWEQTRISYRSTG